MKEGTLEAVEGKQVSPGGNPGLRFAQRSPRECVEHLLCAGGTEGLSTSLMQAPKFTMLRKTCGRQQEDSWGMGPHVPRGPDGVVLGVEEPEGKSQG
nr:uncharacterized protein LOC129058189 isoform X2 [Pongo abelii]